VILQFNCYLISYQCLATHSCLLIWSGMTTLSQVLQSIFFTFFIIEEMRHASKAPQRMTTMKDKANVSMCGVEGATSSKKLLAEALS